MASVRGGVKNYMYYAETFLVGILFQNVLSSHCTLLYAVHYSIVNTEPTLTPIRMRR